jgi:carboxyl-terminal processing protease
MRRALPFLFLAAAVAGAFLAGFTLAGGPSSPGEAAAAAEIAHVRTQLQRRYYRRVPDRVLRQKTVGAMLAALGDPYTEYLEPFAYSELRRRTAASYSGIGLTVVPLRGGFVVSAAPSGPARRAGIRSGDRIVSIDGVLTSRLALEDALGRIIGREGTAVRLGVVRDGTRLQFDVVRAAIRTSPVTSRLLAAPGKRVGYVALRSFSDGTAQLLLQTIARLEEAAVDGLVLDLRGNPGGLLDQAVSVSALFLAQGVVVTVQGAHQPQRVFEVDSRHPISILPLVVLVDRHTASAAEVVAAALRDNGRATVVGENTFGKALVQALEPLPNGAALKLTTARYLTPTGRDLSSGGLKPHVQAVDDPATTDDEALAAALDYVP